MTKVEGWCEVCACNPCQCEATLTKEKVHAVTEACKKALEVEGVTEATIEQNGIKVTLSKKVIVKEE
jgi:hypothetical protein